MHAWNIIKINVKYDIKTINIRNNNCNNLLGNFIGYLQR